MPSQTSTQVIMWITQGVRLRHTPSVDVLRAVHSDWTNRDLMNASKPTTVVSSLATTAMSDFWAAKDRWYPTWPADPTDRGMAVRSVKMWQRC
jgi:hypothetical protein